MLYVADMQTTDPTLLPKMTDDFRNVVVRLEPSDPVQRQRELLGES